MPSMNPKRPLRDASTDSRLAQVRQKRTGDNDANLRKSELGRGNSLATWKTQGEEGGTTTVKTKAGNKQVSYQRDKGGFTSVSVDGKKIGGTIAFLGTSGKSSAERTRKVASSYVKNYYKNNSR